MHALLTALLGLTGAGPGPCGASAARCATAIASCAALGSRTRPPPWLGLLCMPRGLLFLLTCWPGSPWRPAWLPPMSPLCWGPYLLPGGPPSSPAGDRRDHPRWTSERELASGPLVYVVAAVRGATTFAHASVSGVGRPATATSPREGPR